MPRRQYGIVLTLALGVVGAAVAGVVLFSSSRADEVDLTTANLVPADAGVYIAVNTDLDTSQWVTAFNLIERLGEEDPEGELRRSAEEEEGIDWDDDVAPFLGGNTAVFLRSFNWETFQVNGGVIIRANDPERALEVLQEESGLTLLPQEYEGVQVYVDEFGSAFAAILGDHLAVTMDETSIHDVIDVHNGEADSLASAQDFVALRDELSRNFLAFVYLDNEAILAHTFDDVLFQDALQEAGLDLALKPMASVLGAEGDGFTFQGASVSEPGAISPLLTPRESVFASIVPADAAVFVSANGLGTIIRDALDQGEDDIDEALEGTGYSSLDELFADAAGPFGVESIDEITGLFAGETAIAAWFPTGDSDEPEGLLMTEVEDVVAAEALLESVFEGAEPRIVTAGGVEISVIEDGSDPPIAYALDGSTLLIGTEAGLTRTLEGTNGSLLDNATFTGAVADLPTGLGSFGYFDLGSLLRLAEGGVPAQLDEADEALRGMIINMVEERGVVRVSGVLTIAEE